MPTTIHHLTHIYSYHHTFNIKWPFFFKSWCSETTATKSALFIRNKTTGIEEKKHTTAIISFTSINTFEVSQIFFACKWLTWMVYMRLFTIFRIDSDAFLFYFLQDVNQKRWVSRIEFSWPLNIQLQFESALLHGFLMWKIVYLNYQSRNYETEVR